MDTHTLETRSPRAAFRAEVKRSTRTTALAGGLIAIVGMPAWAIFDHLVAPDQAGTFTAIRFLLEVPLVALWLSLFTRFGKRHPELVMVALLVLIQGAIAYMISRLPGAYAPYTLGMSLAIYASSLLLVISWQYTAALIVLSWASLAAAIATAPTSLDSAALATIGFYLGTASVVAFVGQLHRELSAWREFASRMELEHEQERSQKLLQQLERLSREDSLTGLANRRCWDETMAKEFERSRRQGTDLAILLCDLDNLKDLNDRFGHATGDRVLEDVGRALSSRMRSGDLAARVGGDEFGVLCPDTDAGGAAALADSLRVRLSELSSPAPGLPGVTVSIGVAHRKPGDVSPAELTLRADHRLYRAKRTRNAVCGYEPATVR
jgi:diguanylate cyclase (GGDEF)-like protein